MWCMYVFFWESLIWWPKGMLTSLYARPLWPLENVWGHNLQQRDCGQHSSLNSSLHSSLSLYWYYMYYVPPLVVAWSTVEMAQWVNLKQKGAAIKILGICRIVGDIYFTCNRFFRLGLSPYCRISNIMYNDMVVKNGKLAKKRRFRKT